jgi:hypothetical protein
MNEIENFGTSDTTLSNLTAATSENLEISQGKKFYYFLDFKKWGFY